MPIVPHSWRDTFMGVLLLAIAAGASKSFRGDFADMFGLWGSIAAGAAIGVPVVFVFAMMLYSQWRKALAPAIVFPVTFNAFDFTHLATQSQIGETASLAASLVVGAICGLLAAIVLEKILEKPTDERPNTGPGPRGERLTHR